MNRLTKILAIAAILFFIACACFGQNKMDLLTQSKIGQATTGLSLVKGVNTTTGIVQPSGALQVVRVNAGNTDFEFVAPGSLGLGTVTSIGTTSPITGGTITTTGTIGINDAAADGSTKGAASFTASDFNSSSGNISIDYTNGQAASGVNKGFLTSADWTTFNNKQSTVSFAAIGGTPNANGGGISAGVITLQPASASFGGLMTTGSQTFAGSKIFNATVTGMATPAFTVGTYAGGIRGTASGNTTWLQMEQSGGNAIAIYVGNTVLDYNQFYVMDPGGTLNTNNFEFSVLGSGYSTSGLVAANSTLAWTRSGLTNGFRIGTQSGPLIQFTGGFAATNERMRIDNSGNISIGSTASVVYRTTNGGGDVNGLLLIDAGNSVSTAGSKALVYDNTNGLSFTAANGTRRIARAGVQTGQLVNTSGSETGSFDIYTKAANAAIDMKLRIDTLGKPIFLSTVTAGGTTGNQTINKASGTVNIAAAGTTVTVTNSLCTTSSIVFAVIRTNDATAQVLNVVPGAGSFVINIVACAAETSIGFLVIN